MNVLIACEESQAVCVEFRKRGHIAFSCDIQKCSGGHPEWHIYGDVTKVLNGKCIFKTEDEKTHSFMSFKTWDLIIAHPPCTYMSKAGARWMYKKAGELNQERYEQAMKAKEFFMMFYNSNCPRVAIENPVPLKIVNLPNPSQVIEPHQFGDAFSKKTFLWLKGLCPLLPNTYMYDYKPYLPSNTSSFARGGGGSRGVAHNAKDASKTFKGIAKAMAEQWG